MANVHTLRDFAPEDTTTTRPFPPAPGSRYGAGGGNASLINISGAPAERPSCMNIVFPGFTVRSFIFAVSMVEVIVFIVSCVLGSRGLTPTEISLNKLGASYGPPLAEGQVWRLVTPVFLHASFWHLLFNVFFQLRMGFALEAQYGLKLIAFLYFATGIAGNLLSVAIAPCKVAVGASTAGFGLIGLQLAQIALTWHLLQRKEEVIFNIVLFAMMTIMLSVAPHSVVDWRGHLGGLAAGFALGVIYADTTGTSRPRWYRTGKSVAVTSLLAILGVCLGVIYGIPMHKRGC